MNINLGERNDYYLITGYIFEKKRGGGYEGGTKLPSFAFVNNTIWLGRGISNTINNAGIQ